MVKERGCLFYAILFCRFVQEKISIFSTASDMYSVHFMQHAYADAHSQPISKRMETKNERMVRYQCYQCRSPVVVNNMCIADTSCTCNVNQTHFAK